MKHTKRTTQSMRIITKMVSCLLIIISSSVFFFCVVAAAAAAAAVKTRNPPTPLPPVQVLYQGLSATYFTGSVPEIGGFLWMWHGYLIRSRHDQQGILSLYASNV